MGLNLKCELNSLFAGLNFYYFHLVSRMEKFIILYNLTMQELRLGAVKASA